MVIIKAANNITFNFSPKNPSYSTVQSSPLCIVGRLGTGKKNLSGQGTMGRGTRSYPCVSYIENTSWKVLAYGIYARVVDVSEIERVSAANE